MARISSADLLARIEQLTAQVASLTTEIEALKAKPLTHNQQIVAQMRKPAYVRPADPLADRRAEYRAYCATQRDEIIASRDFKRTVPCFDAWLASHA